MQNLCGRYMRCSIGTAPTPQGCPSAGTAGTEQHARSDCTCRRCLQQRNCLAKRAARARSQSMNQSAAAAFPAQPADTCKSVGQGMCSTAGDTWDACSSIMMRRNSSPSICSFSSSTSATRCRMLMFVPIRSLARLHTVPNPSGQELLDKMIV